jgi:hypothetical protein
LQPTSTDKERTIAIRFFARKRHQQRDTVLPRPELFSLEQLKRHAVALAGRHVIDPRPGPDRLLSQLADNARVLRSVYDAVSATVKPGQPVDPAEAWLLDNFYLLEQSRVAETYRLPAARGLGHVGRRAVLPQSLRRPTQAALGRQSRAGN